MGSHHAGLSRDCDARADRRPLGGFGRGEGLWRPGTQSATSRSALANEWNQIERLTRRIDAMESRLMPKRVPRTFRMIVENHLEADDEIARFCAASDDLLIARVMVPHEIRPGETASEAYQRELASIGK